MFHIEDATFGDFTLSYTLVEILEIIRIYLSF